MMISFQFYLVDSTWLLFCYCWLFLLSILSSRFVMGIKEGQDIYDFQFYLVDSSATAFSHDTAGTLSILSSRFVIHKRKPQTPMDFQFYLVDSIFMQDNVYKIYNFQFYLVDSEYSSSSFQGACRLSILSSRFRLIQ